MSYTPLCEQALADMAPALESTCHVAYCLAAHLRLCFLKAEPWVTAYSAAELRRTAYGSTDVPLVVTVQVLGVLGSAEQAMSTAHNPGGNSALPLGPSQAQPSAGGTPDTNDAASPSPEITPYLQYGPLYPLNGKAAAS